MSDGTKAWLPVSQKGKVGASVDGIKLGYGKKNAVSVSKTQLERLRQGTPEVQAEQAEDSGDKKDN